MLLPNAQDICRAGTSMVQTANANFWQIFGKYRKKPAWKILQNSPMLRILAFMHERLLKRNKKRNHLLISVFLLDI